MFNQAVTIFNRYKDKVSGYDAFKRTVLKNTHYESVDSIKIGNMEVVEGSTISVVIPLDTKGYVKPNQELTSDTWTLKEKDIIVKGEITQDITNSIELDAYSEKMVITSVSVVDYAYLDELNNFTVKGK